MFSLDARQQKYETNPKETHKNRPNERTRVGEREQEFAEESACCTCTSRNLRHGQLSCCVRYPALTNDSNKNNNNNNEENNVLVFMNGVFWRGI